MRRNSNSRFQRGSGVFICQSCNRRTRDTDEAACDTGYCAHCYALASHQNSVFDGCADQWTIDVREREAKALMAKGKFSRHAVESMFPRLFAFKL
jgi:hypothetical protein